MSLEILDCLCGRAVVLPGDDIDTDRIIPARFLKCVTFDDLTPGLFADDRALMPEGRRHPLDDPAHADATILVVGRNFGCGSSREHAPQAIRRSGFRAVIGHSFAEIFAGNAAGIGLPCVTLDDEPLGELREFLEVNPRAEVTVDVENLQVSARCGEQGTSFPVHLNEGTRQAFLSGQWDMIAGLLEGDAEIAATEVRLGLRPA